ncbi:MAG: type I-C CRISPR-associated protein Cas5c [Cyanobacteria bacterium J06600_6]
MITNTPLKVKVWGDFACFTRPEFGAERVSYEVITPSAARGVLEAIFWKPEFVWKILQIKVLNPIKHFSIFRNEINNLQSDRSAKNPEYHYYADDDRAQRHTLGLKDVAYIIEADIKLKPHANAHPAKYRDQFRRRVKQGRCYHQPYLGMREFSAFFGEPEGKEEVANLNDELGLMLLDMEFSPVDKAGTIQYFSHDELGAKVTQGKAKPQFFRASLKDGVLRIPE